MIAIAAASCSTVDCSATTAPKSSLLDSLANVRKQPMRQWTLLVVRVGQRARIGGGTDGSARIGSAILYGVRAVTAWNLKPMGHCSIANGSAATAWPGLARTHAHAHAGQRCWSQCRWGVRPGPYAQTCEAFGLPGGHECDQRSAGTKPKCRSRGRTGQAIAASSARRLQYTDTSKEGLA